MMKIKVYCGAAGSFHLWAHVKRISGDMYRITFDNDTENMGGNYYFNPGLRLFVAAGADWEA